MSTREELVQRTAEALRAKIIADADEMGTWVDEDDAPLTYFGIDGDVNLIGLAEWMLDHMAKLVIDGK